MSMKYKSLSDYEAYNPTVKRKEIARRLGISAMRYSNIRLTPAREDRKVRLSASEVLSIAELLNWPVWKVVKIYNTAAKRTPEVSSLVRPWL